MKWPLPFLFAEMSLCNQRSVGERREAGGSEGVKEGGGVKYGLATVAHPFCHDHFFPCCVAFCVCPHTFYFILAFSLPSPLCRPFVCLVTAVHSPDSIQPACFLFAHGL